MERVESVEESVEKLIELYEASCDLAREVIASGDYSGYDAVRYPKIAVEVTQWVPVDRREPFGYVDEAGTYSATCLLYTSPSPRDATLSRMPSSA